MKRYCKSHLKNPTEWGEIKFEWAKNGTEYSTCIQKEGQPALHFENLLKEAGYVEVTEDV
jgi:hypothetical protein